MKRKRKRPRRETPIKLKPGQSMKILKMFAAITVSQALVAMLDKGVPFSIEVEGKRKRKKK